MKRLLAAIVVAVALAGCATGAPESQPTSAAETVILRTAQGLYVAHAAFQGASIAAEVAANSGALKPTQALAVLRGLEAAHTALTAATAAYTAGDMFTAGIQASVAATHAATAQARINEDETNEGR